MSERRWGGVVIPITEEGKVLMINNTKDNKGKRERSWFSKEMESVSGYQFPGGAVENGDGSVESGVIREVLEEANLENIDMERLSELGVNADILQEGRVGKGEDRFGVRIFELALTKEEEEFLRKNGAIEAGAVREIRPRDRVIGALRELYRSRTNDFGE